MGDAEFQKKCLGKMEDVASREGSTILFVSHNHAAIRSLCTHAFVLKSGIATQKKDVASALDENSSDGKPRCLRSGRVLPPSPSARAGLKK